MAIDVVSEDNLSMRLYLDRVDCLIRAFPRYRPGFLRLKALIEVSVDFNKSELEVRDEVHQFLIILLDHIRLDFDNLLGSEQEVDEMELDKIINTLELQECWSDEFYLILVTQFEERVREVLLDGKNKLIGSS